MPFAWWCSVKPGEMRLATGKRDSMERHVLHLPKPPAWLQGRLLTRQLEVHNQGRRRNVRADKQLKGVFQWELGPRWEDQVTSNVESGVLKLIDQGAAIYYMATIWALYLERRGCERHAY